MESANGKRREYGQGSISERTASVLAVILILSIASCSLDSKGAKGSVAPNTAARSPIASGSAALDCAASTHVAIAAPEPGQEEVLGAIILTTGRQLQTVVNDAGLYVAKDGFLIRSDAFVSVGVASESRASAGLYRGTDGKPVQSVHASRCAANAGMGGWSDFFGGYVTRMPECVGIVVTVGQRQQLLHVSVGAPCM